MNEPIDELKWLNDRKCGKCKQYLPLEEFSNKSKSPDGLGHICRECDSDRGLMRKFGITREVYDNLFNKQQGRCAICNCQDPSSRDSRRKNFCIDHDHQTGKIRSLLCITCNRALGLLGDSITAIESALRYLKSSQNPSS